MLEIKHDFHVHTTFSDCCSDERQIPEIILPELVRHGIRRVGFADHIWANPAFAPNDFYRPQTFERIKRLREILKSLPDYGIKIYVGCEAEMLAPGKFGITPELAEQLDIVVLATDHFHFKGIVEQPRSESPRDIGVHMLEFLLPVPGVIWQQPWHIHVCRLVLCNIMMKLSIRFRTTKCWMHLLSPRKLV